jgi:hypothetical protein
MDPAWSGRGGALVPTAELCRSCVSPAHQLLYLNCNVVPSSLIIMLLLKLLYLILSFFCFIMKNSTPLHPLWPGLGGGTPPPPPPPPPCLCPPVRLGKLTPNNFSALSNQSKFANIDLVHKTVKTKQMIKQLEICIHLEHWVENSKTLWIWTMQRKVNKEKISCGQVQLVCRKNNLRVLT